MHTFFVIAFLTFSLKAELQFKLPSTPCRRWEKSPALWIQPIQAHETLIVMHGHWKLARANGEKVPALGDTCACRQAPIPAVAMER
jgi:hypothetical protein